MHNLGKFTSPGTPTMQSFIVLSLLCAGAFGAYGQTVQSGNRGAEPVTIVSNQDQPTALTVDAENIYWVSDSRSTIKKVQKTGGTTVTLATEQADVFGLWVDRENVYFNTSHEIRRVSKSGGPVTTLATIIGSGPRKVAIDEKYIYFVNRRSDEDQLMKVSKEGGTPVTLVPRLGALKGIASDNSSVYWTEDYPGRVRRIGIEGRGATTVGDCRGAEEVLVDAASFYCKTSGAPTEIIRFRKSDGSIIQHGTLPGDESFNNLVLQGRTLYAINVMKGIYSIDDTLTRTTLLIPLHLETGYFTVDAQAIYWTNYKQGTVMCLPKN